ncbi:MAG: hypothetical protein QOK37_699 [Thermoanaerobaculia bacterium]|jgi:hypothetical protein|nr:hypothetical protein [Thermoanaerobaculia bacterium]
MRVCAPFVHADRAELSNTEVSSGAVISEDSDRCVSIGETLFSEIVVAHAECEDVFESTTHGRLRAPNMKKESGTTNDVTNEVDDMQPEYDFSGGVRGKYYRPGKTIIRMTIDEDVARYFYSSELLNEALRKLIAEGRAPEPRDE